MIQRMEDPRINLIGMSREDMTAFIKDIGEAPFRAKQIWHWVYHHGITDFDAMQNISKTLKEKLNEHAVIRRPYISQDLLSTDGTRKWLLAYDDKNEAETVYIPEEDRGSLCVSSQVGCTLTCRFCHTGTQTLVRNLTTEEIVGQFMIARDALGEWPTPSDERRMLSNIVMMGMGEPLFNYDNVAKALHIIMDSEGIALSKRRITLSTSGVVPEIERLGREVGVNLAISLHAVRDEIRDDIMPINKKYPLDVLLQACRDYPAASNARRITFEYVMLKGVNDSDADAHELERILRGIPAKVNLIPFNPWPGAPYECSSNNRIRSFSSILFDKGISAPIRATRGQDIFAACGQLKSESQRIPRHKQRGAQQQD